MIHREYKEYEFAERYTEGRNDGLFKLDGCCNTLNQAEAVSRGILIIILGFARDQKLCHNFAKLAR